MSANPEDDKARQEINRLVAERAALTLRLEKSIDVRNNLTEWHARAEAKLAAIHATLKDVKDKLPSNQALRQASDAALALFEAARAASKVANGDDIAEAERALRVLREFHDAVRSVRDSLSDSE